MSRKDQNCNEACYGNGNQVCDTHLISGVDFLNNFPECTDAMIYHSNLNAPLIGVPDADAQPSLRSVCYYITNSGLGGDNGNICSQRILKNHDIPGGWESKFLCQCIQPSDPVPPPSPPEECGSVEMMYGQESSLVPFRNGCYDATDEASCNGSYENRYVGVSNNCEWNADSSSCETGEVCEPPPPPPACAPGSGLVQKDDSSTLTTGCSRLDYDETTCNNSFEKMEDGNYYMCQWAGSSCTRQTEQCLPDFEGDTGIPYCSAGVWQPNHNLGASSAEDPPYCYCRHDYTGTNHGDSLISRCLPSTSRGLVANMTDSWIGNGHPQ